MAGITAGRLNIEIVAEVARLTADLDRVKSAVKSASGDIARSAKNANDNIAGMAPALNRAGAAAGSTRAGMQQLGFQINDMATQFASGTKPMQIFGQQAGQLIQALQLMAGGTSKFATFMGGPWGVALTAATVVLVPLIGKLFETEDATKKSEKATRSFTDVLSDGASSWKEIADAARSYADQLAKNKQLTIDQMEVEANATAIRLGHARVTRVLLEAELQIAKLRTDVASQSGSAEGIMQALRMQAAVEEQIKENRDAIAGLKQAEAELINSLSGELAKLRTDDEYRLKVGFDLERKRAEENIRNARELGEAKAAITRREEAALDALQKKTKAVGEETLKLAKVTGAEIAKALGTTITSGLRTPAQNRAAKGATNSYHLTGQAIDIPLTVNGRPLTKAGIRAVLEPLGVQIKQIFGPGDKDHDDHFHIAFALKRLAPDQVADAQADAAKAAEKVAEAWNKVLGDLTISVIQARVDTNEQVAGLLGDAATKDWDAMLADLDARRNLRDAQREAEEQQSERDRRRALDTAHEIADIIGGGVGNALGELADALEAAFPKFAQDIGKALGESGLGDVFKAMGAGAKFGGAVDSLFDAVGIKSSKTGAQIGGAIGQFAGPLGMIAGSILGGIVGGMMKSTPRASATVSVIAGEAMETAIKGSSGKLKAIAGEMANSVIGGLEQLASALGAELTGNANVSIGQRNGNFRVDTSGSGITKTSKGAIDFGEDKAAAIAFALQDAIKDGVLGGLSASLQKLITSDGDLQSQLQKALNFKSVFDELAKRDDPAKWAQDEITRWHDAMAKIFAEASATAEELAELERLTGIKRTEAAKEAAEAIEAAQVNNDRRNLEIQIMELEGKTAEALAASRQLELEGMEESLRPLQERIYALTDEATAATAAAEATRLATEAQEEAARVALEAAQAARELQLATAQTQGDLLLRLYKATGQTGAADLLETQRFLGSLPEELRELGQSVIDAERAISSAAASGSGSSSGSTGNSSFVGPAVADAQAAAQAAADAADAAAQAEADRLAKLTDLRSRLTDAYDREASAIQQIIDGLEDAKAGLIAFNDELSGKLGGRDSFLTIQRKFMQTSALAATGDTTAMGNLPGQGRDFLEQARSRASTMADFHRQVAFVQRAVNDAIGAADEAIDYQEAQLDALNRAADGIVDMKESFETFADLLRENTEAVEAMRSENTQLLLSVDNNTYKSTRILKGTTRNGNVMQTETVF